MAATVALLSVQAGCSSRRVVHHVRRGETLVRIGHAYGVPYQAIARANNLRDASRIETGARLVIPDVERAVPVTPSDGLALAPRHRAPVRARPRGALQVSWPVRGTVTSEYGRRGRRHHDGIDISAPTGTRVRAAAAGEVIFVGSVRGYGRMIIIMHPGGFTTAYAHHARQLTRRGARVRRGEVIATVGRSGRTTGPNLHFEVRQNDVAYDPIPLLPALDARVARGD